MKMQNANFNIRKGVKLKTIFFTTCFLKVGGWPLGWSIFAILVDMVDILDFVVDVTSKGSIFHQTLSEWR